MKRKIQDFMAEINAEVLAELDDNDTIVDNISAFVEKFTERYNSADYPKVKSWTVDDFMEVHNGKSN